MSKHNSKITLVGTDKVRVSEFKMKTKQYPNLPIFHVNYNSPYSPMQFPITAKVYSVHFVLKRLFDDTKFQIIRDNLYPALSIDELLAMKVTEQNVLQLEESNFLALCSSCNAEINKGEELIVCATDGCSFKIRGMTICHHIIDNCNYCIHCKNTSIHLHDCDKINNVERTYDKKMNDDYVTAYLLFDDSDEEDEDDDDENMNAANTMISIKCTTICRNLPTYEYDRPKYIDDDLFQLPPAEQLETTIRANEQSIVSRLSDDLSTTDTLSDYRQPYMLLENNYDDSNCIVTSLINKTESVSAMELEIMILKWKNSCMISFGTFGRKTLHGFLSWHIWFEININQKILDRYGVSIKKKLREKKCNIS